MKPSIAIVIFCTVFACTVFHCAVASSQSSVPIQNGTVCSSKHFLVHVFKGGPSSPDVLRLCEESRAELQRVWGAGNASDSWEPRCEIVVHGSRESYLGVVGQGGDQTRGSSLIHAENGKIKARRIDLLMDPSAGLTALPHELTHVILADHFQGQTTPHWLDEGIAMLADTYQKQLLHRRDCHHAIESRTALPLAELLTLEQFTSAEQMPAFYGQSLTLIQMLANQGDPSKLVSFGIDVRKIGYDRALRDHFGIDGVIDLERRWKAHIAEIRASQTLQPVVAVTFQP